MNDHDTRSELIWAYLHGELSPEERVRLLRTVQADPELQKLMSQLEKDHRYLRELSPWMSRSDADLEKAVSDSWERDQLPEAAPVAKAKKEGYGWLSWLGEWQPLVATAAVLLLILSASLCWIYIAASPQDVVWKQITWMSPVVRGGTEGVVSLEPEKRDQLASLLQRALNQSMRAAVRQAARGGYRGWSLAAVEIEPDGALVLSITAEPTKPDGTRGSWRRRYDDAAIFTETVDDLAAQIARDLTASAATPQAGREDAP